jgi:hypothetical protein
MKQIILICILSLISIIYGTKQVLPTVAQISYILSQIPKDKKMPIEMRIKFAVSMYENMIKYNVLMNYIYLEILKKKEEEKKRKKEEKIKEILEHFSQKTKSNKFLPFLRFLH